ncbi:hypothetical protein Bbelb_255530 [Branchiostoma belcheri]|nr:hypothetical protein Bbelb_380280 [Branchiostoma belcheri]KAI8496898.1 hypothetical protein Bbelb_255530 [Branchiostoma belcheri]
MAGLNMDSETCTEPSSEDSVIDTSPELDTSQADNPLILRSAVPRRRDLDQLFEKLERVFRQEEETNGAVSTAVEFRVNTAQTKCLIQVELRKGNGYGYYICPWPCCRYGRRARHQVAAHIRKIHFGPNFCSECGHVTKTQPAIQRHRKRKGHNGRAQQPLLYVHQMRSRSQHML